MNFNFSIKKIKRNILIIFLMSSICLLLISCNSADQAPVEKDNKEYISITETHKNEEGQLIVSLFTFFTENNEVEKAIDFPFTAQYSLGAYDLADNIAYLSKDVNNVGDQIFSYNLETKEEEQITDNLFAVNYIIPTKDKVFFAACKMGQANVCLGAYDKNTKEIKYWGNDGDTNIENICVDEETASIYVSTYSEKEDRYNLQQQTSDDFVIPDHSIWKISFDFEDETKLFTIPEKWARMLLINDSKLLVIYDHKYNDSATPSECIYYDLEENKELEFKLPPYRIEKGDASFSEDGKFLYVLSQLNSDEKRNLYKFNLEDKSYELLFKSSENGFINNCQLIKH